MSIKSSTRLTGLYAITAQNQLIESNYNETDFIFSITQALQAGVNIIQYRDKINGANLRFKQAYILLNLCREYNALCIVNDDIALAKKIGADGVHIGINDGSIATARNYLGEHAMIGVSCYNRLELAVLAERKGANYVAFGTTFASMTKPNNRISGLKIIAEAKQKLSIPVCAIGGISASNVYQVWQQGADMVAVISAVLGAENIQDIKNNCQQLLAK